MNFSPFIISKLKKDKSSLFSRQIHLKNLKKIKPIVKSFNLNYFEVSENSSLKPKFKLRDRFDIIEKENKNLFDKINYYKRRSNCYPKLLSEFFDHTKTISDNHSKGKNINNIENIENGLRNRKSIDNRSNILTYGRKSLDSTIPNTSLQFTTNDPYSSNNDYLTTLNEKKLKSHNYLRKQKFQALVQGKKTPTIQSKKCFNLKANSRKSVNLNIKINEDLPLEIFKGENTPKLPLLCSKSKRQILSFSNKNVGGKEYYFQIYIENSNFFISASENNSNSLILVQVPKDKVKPLLDKFENNVDKMINFVDISDNKLVLRNPINS